MGNDGGDIPKRKELVKEKQKVEVPTAQSIAIGRSRYCNLTKEKFKEPLAICRLGYIYNFENILAALIQKSLAEKYAYIKKMSDLKKIQIERASSESLNFIVCPITKLEYNGFNKFVAIWTCGHVLSRKAFKQVRTEQESSDSKACIICQQPYAEKDVIDLNLEGVEVEKMRIQLINKKKDKKKEKQSEDVKETEKMGDPSKRVKREFPLNSIERLDGEFRDVIREREKFRELFEKKESK